MDADAAMASDEYDDPSVSVCDAADAVPGTEGEPLGEGALDESEDGQQPRDLSQPEARRLRAALRHEQETRKQLMLELRDQQKRVAKLERQLANVKAENKQILLDQSRVEVDNFDSLEAAENREKVLKQEVLQLRQSFEAGSQDAAEAAAKRAVKAESHIADLQAVSEQLAVEVKERTLKSAAAEHRAESLEHEVETLRRQLAGFREAHEAELELVREEYQLRERLQQGKLGEEKQNSAAREAEAAHALQKSQQQTEDARQECLRYKAAAEAAAVDAQAAAIEAAAVRQEAAAERAAALEDVDLDSDLGGPEQDPIASNQTAKTTKEISALYDRINVLERRCCTLQRKLNSRPVVQNSTAELDTEIGSQIRPAWEPWLASNIGPRASEIVVLLYFVLDTLLERFSRRLLKRDMWRWAWYGHILVLYTFSASFYAETETDLGNPMDGLNLHMTKGATDAVAGGVLATTAQPVR